VAVRTPTIVYVGDNVRRVTWSGLLNGDTGLGWEAWDEHERRMIQVTGTFGAGGNARIQGSLLVSPNQSETATAEADWHRLHDDSGNDLDFNGVAPNVRIERIEEGPAWVRPAVTAGDGTTNLTVTLITYRQGPR
jgi:hypothetical protein